MAISCCTAMKDSEQDHEGNNFLYDCPLGKVRKTCFEITSTGSDINVDSSNHNMSPTCTDAFSLKCNRCGSTDVDEHIEEIYVEYEFSGYLRTLKCNNCNQTDEQYI